MAIAKTSISILDFCRTFHLFNTKGKTMKGFPLTFMVDMLAILGK